jgi:hypothetical protein
VARAQLCGIGGERAQQLERTERRDGEDRGRDENLDEGESRLSCAHGDDGARARSRLVCRSRA